MILMKKMPGVRAVCKKPLFVQSELSVPPGSTAQLRLQLPGVTPGVPTVLGDRH